MARRTARGLTLAEMLIVVALLAVLAALAAPTLNVLDDQRLSVAAAEVRDTLRLARAEAMRRGQRVLVDAETVPGHLLLQGTDCVTYGSPKVITDPRTKRSFDLDVTGGPFSAGVVVTPRFLAGGVAYGGLVFDAGGAAVAVCQVDSMSSQGAPQPGSGVTLSLDGRGASVTLDAATGRVTTP